MKLNDWQLTAQCFVLVAACCCIVAFEAACSRPPEQNSPALTETQKLPFDRQPKANGISPSLSFVPSNTKLPEGTTIPVTLRSTISSASARTGDTFSAIVDEPLVIDRRIVVAKGTIAIGRILEAKNSTGLLDPGYLRLVLATLNVDSRSIAIETSSIFTKAGPREEVNVSAGIASSATHDDITLETGRRLYFRLAQSAELRHANEANVEAHSPTQP